jgi:hypothetical protein
MGNILAAMIGGQRRERRIMAMKIARGGKSASCGRA